MLQDKNILIRVLKLGSHSHGGIISAGKVGLEV